MAVNDVYELSVVFTNPIADGDLVNVLHYRQTAYDTLSSDLAMLTECITHVIASLVTFYIPMLHSDFTLKEIQGFILNKPLIGTTVPDGTVGTAVGEYLPLRSAPVITKITGLRGRSYRGRVYLQAPMEVDQNRGGLTTAAIIAYQAMIDDVLQVNNVTTTNVWKMAVYSRELSTPPTLILDNVVLTAPVQAVLGTIRGRQKVS